MATVPRATGVRILSFVDTTVTPDQPANVLFKNIPLVEDARCRAILARRRSPRSED